MGSADWPPGRPSRIVWIAIRPGGVAARSRRNRGKPVLAAASNLSPHRRGSKENASDPPRPEKDLSFDPKPFRLSVPRSIMVALATVRELSAMKAQLARFLISVVAMFIGLITFLELDAGWIPAAFIVLSGFVVSEAVFRRFADQETIQRDLEERVRNQHL
jgi:hypothetical protein